MEGLIILLFIVFFVVSSSKKKGKKKKAKGGASRPRPRHVPSSRSSTFARQAEEFAEAFGRQAREFAETFDGDGDGMKKILSEFSAPAREPEAEAPRPTVKAAAPKVRNSNLPDAEGCLGGSLPHTHEEGEPRREHAQHLQVIHEEEQAQLQAEAVARELRDMSIHQLRRAIVISEILDRPKALRRR